MMRDRLLICWWADHIYRKMNKEEARDPDWWLRVFIV